MAPTPTPDLAANAAGSATGTAEPAWELQEVLAYGALRLEARKKFAIKYRLIQTALICLFFGFFPNVDVAIECLHCNSYWSYGLGGDACARPSGKRWWHQL
jgi:hypothetical protein